MMAHRTDEREPHSCFYASVIFIHRKLRTWISFAGPRWLSLCICAGRTRNYIGTWVGFCSASALPLRSGMPSLWRTSPIFPSSCANSKSFAHMPSSRQHLTDANCRFPAKVCGPACCCCTGHPAVARSFSSCCFSEWLRPASASMGSQRNLLQKLCPLEANTCYSTGLKLRRCPQFPNPC